MKTEPKFDRVHGFRIIFQEAVYMGDELGVGLIVG